MQKLPFGIQEFSKLIEGQYIYVDKTEQILHLLNREYYFLSRPRRFGKSLLLNTIKEIFLGKKELFKGLWIYDKIDWTPHPVIKISFSNISYHQLGLDVAIAKELDKVAHKNKLELDAEDYPGKFRELIEKLSENGKVVVLIDEYDKPIVDYLTDLDKANENRSILKSFYSIIKDSDQYLRFFMITGVSKFSKVSIFSDLNNLDDITVNPKYATLVGWTQYEIEKYFQPFIDDIQTKYRDFYPDIKPEIKKWYNGYSWDGENFVYNPVSLMKLFDSCIFGNYWFNTGTPTFLIDLFRKNHFTPFDIENKKVDIDLLEKYDLSNMSLLPLLFQTGYLTIKKQDIFRQTIILDYPNQEVKNAFSKHLLAGLTIGNIDKTDLLLSGMVDDFESERIDKFMDKINLLFKNIPYTLIDEKEKYFHSIFFVVMRMVGFKIEAEVLTIDGRIDAVVKTENQVVVLEFKINQDAKIAIRQIQEKAYAEKYADDPRSKVLLGINFNTETRRVEEYEIVAG